ncbi:MAG: FHA domain-containing protein [Deltaproteobacteria bacterium]|nr:FHA domain-containing protein [Deltaproteobacteria bacterium]
MTIDERLFDLLACPHCKGSLLLVDGGFGLRCESCHVTFPIQHGVPVMRVDAVPARKREEKGIASGNQPSALFRIVAGPQANRTFELRAGTCQVLGRADTDVQRTAVFNVDVQLALDEGTKSMIMAYLRQQFSSLPFHRVPDLLLTDGGISRLHAMVVAEGGKVGLLDLVSKNGTEVNGVEVESKLLTQGDVIELGETKIIFEGFS